MGQAKTSEGDGKGASIISRHYTVLHFGFRVVQTKLGFEQIYSLAGRRKRGEQRGETRAESSQTGFRAV